MREETAELITKAFALLAWASAFVACIAGVSLLLGSMQAPYNLVFGGLGTKAWGTIISSTAVGAILAAVGLAYLGLGAGLWGRMPWARALLVSLALLSAVLSAVAIVIGLASHRGVGAPLTGLIIAAVEIGVFQYLPEVKRLFVQESYAHAIARAAASKRVK